MKVSVDEFISRHKPRGKRSVLQPFADDIEKLVGQAYSLDQIVEWLGQNGITITRAAVFQFRSRGGKRLKSAPAATTVSSSAYRSPLPRGESLDGNSRVEKRNGTNMDSAVVAKGIREAARKSQEEERGVDVSGYKTLL